MNIYVYSDESGVFDKKHNEFFVYGGLIFFSKEERDAATRKYSHVEKTLRRNGLHDKSTEIKAATVSNKEKSKLYRSLNGCVKFGGIVDQYRIHDEIFKEKKSKQRYLDYVYKISLKHAFNKLISAGMLNPADVLNIYIFCDEHSTATNGRYELKESLEQEFKIGTFNHNYVKFFPPIFNSLQNVSINFCDSKCTLLIRAADIVANHIFHAAMEHRNFKGINNLTIKSFP